MNIIQQKLLKKSIQETLSDQIVEGNNLSLLEKKIESMCYGSEQKGFKNIVNNIKGIYNYYFKTSIKINKRAYTKILYKELKSKKYPDRLAITLAKATPVPIENNYLKKILALAYGITIGRTLSERHIKWISEKSGIKEKTLTNASFISELPLHIITAAQIYPQIYAFTKGISETTEKLLHININITPNYEQILYGLYTLSISQYIYSQIKNKYVRAYHGATTFPFGAITFWTATIHDKYIKYQEKIIESQNRHKP